MYLNLIAHAQVKCTHQAQNHATVRKEFLWNKRVYIQIIIIIIHINNDKNNNNNYSIVNIYIHISIYVCIVCVKVCILYIYIYTQMEEGDLRREIRGCRLPKKTKELPLETQ